MNYKARETRAMFAMGSLAIAMLLGADALGNIDTPDYYHEQALLNVLGFAGVGVALFAWNAVQYALFLRRNR